MTTSSPTTLKLTSPTPREGGNKAAQIGRNDPLFGNSFEYGELANPSTINYQDSTLKTESFPGTGSLSFGAASFSTGEGEPVVSHQNLTRAEDYSFILNGPVNFEVKAKPFKDIEAPIQRSAFVSAVSTATAEGAVYIAEGASKAITEVITFLGTDATDAIGNDLILNAVFGRGEKKTEKSEAERSAEESKVKENRLALALHQQIKSSQENIQAKTEMEIDVKADIAGKSDQEVANESGYLNTSFTGKLHNNLKTTANRAFIGLKRGWAALNTKAQSEGSQIKQTFKKKAGTISTADNLSQERKGATAQTAMG